jgi:UDP-glucose 4-epimerase
MVIPSLVHQAVAAKPLTVHGTGTQTRCFCHVHDVVDALLRLLDHPGAVGEVFNVGSRDEIAIYSLARRIVEAAQSPSPIELVPYEEAYERGFEDMVRRVPDTTKLEQLTGWHPTKSLDDILAESIAEARLEHQALLARA